MKASLEKINLGTIWIMLAGTATAIIWMFTTFASAADLNELKTELAYSSYYSLLERHQDATDAGRDELAAEFARQMERLRAKICEEDPEWERCDGD